MTVRVRRPVYLTGEWWRIQAGFWGCSARLAFAILSVAITGNDDYQDEMERIMDTESEVLRQRRDRLRRRWAAR